MLVKLGLTAAGVAAIAAPATCTPILARRLAIFACGYLAPVVARNGHVPLTGALSTP